MICLLDRAADMYLLPRYSSGGDCESVSPNLYRCKIYDWLMSISGWHLGPADVYDHVYQNTLFVVATQAMITRIIFQVNNSVWQRIRNYVHVLLQNITSTTLSTFYIVAAVTVSPDIKRNHYVVVENILDWCKTNPIMCPDINIHINRIMYRKP